MTDTPDPAQPASQRLFFALWPDDATREALDRTGKWLHSRWGGRRMRADTLHLTLAFLGNTPLEARDRLWPHVAALRAGAFDLLLDQTGYWPHNRIGWLGCREISAPLAGLAERLRHGLREARVPFDAKPFVPHVTLLRQAESGPVSSCSPVHWPVRDFVLVASTRDVSGTHYRILRRWPLS